MDEGANAWHPETRGNPNHMPNFKITQTSATELKVTNVSDRKIEGIEMKATSQPNMFEVSYLDETGKKVTEVVEAERAF